MSTIDKQYIDVKCIKATQPIGPMFIGVIDSEDLEKITYADVRRLIEDSGNREIEDYIGIQRKLDTKRAKNEIGKYVNLVDATFPNSIILSISSENAQYIESEGILRILYKDDIAKVLDGQHRIAGFEYYNNQRGTFELIVTIYIDMELEDQAIVFATINKEQRNVSGSLVTDLFAFAESRSPQKTGHNIARALNNKENSPFYNKIKILGNADSSSETITQSTFVESLLKYITKDKQLDRDFYRRNKNKKNAKLDYVDSKDAERLFLRNIFIDDESDIKIAQILWNYFWAVQHKWPTAWNEVANNNILNKSTGFIALMRFFKLAYLSFNKPNEIITKEEFKSIFDLITLEEEDFNRQKYVPGGIGQSALYNDLKEQSGL
ncbi:DGQHR domain-containing protein [Flavobacterium sp. N502540]|uniref:DGQHR domain-containing protein n=1 Tax=Flavobacterium sp. N502540 TaxID=2986838 RepID=UPI00222404D7|nr:DGQHR domain-containing protein [Flavobacterium sp. N502540]